MHEYSLVRSLLDRVDAEARAHSAASVQRVRVRIGELSGVEAPLFRTAFLMARERTVCATAELEVIDEAARWQCSRCEHEVERGAVLRCPHCGGPAKLTAGGDLLLETLEMEVP